MKKRLAILFLFAACSISMYGCKRNKAEEIDLSSIHTSGEEVRQASMETSADESSSVPEAAKQPASVPGIKTEILTEAFNKISIEYPSIELDSSEKSETVNELLKADALSIIKGYDTDIDNDALTITCKIISADSKRITAVYEGLFEADGAAYPVNIFYSDTVDLSECKNITLDHYVDAYTMAGYLLSPDCKFDSASKELTDSLTEYKNTMDISYYTELFENSDFPVSGGSSINFPQSFSYEDKGVIYASIPVTHALGDYAIIKFIPDTK